MLSEVFKPIKGYEDLYQVSNKGNVSNYRKVMRPFVNNSGYKVIDLTKDGDRKKYLIHRLVAETFIENPNDYLIVNHKDGNKFNNSVSNLEWCNNSMNIIHARCTGLNPYNYPTLGKKLGKTSKYRGVTFDKSRSKWQACLYFDKKSHEQKRFDSEVDAAKWYNYLVEKYNRNLPLNTFKS